MLISFQNGQTGVVLRVKILDKTRDDGGGLTGLTPSTTGLVIATIADTESTPTVYRSANSTIEPIATLGQYQAPSAGSCRFQEVDPTNHRGVYEIHLPDARFAVPSARSLLISIFGPPNAMDCDALIPLTVWNPYAVNGGFDPWAVDLPGSYGLNTAGARLGLVDATISSRSTFDGGPVSSVVNPVTVGSNLDKSDYRLAPSGLDSIEVEPGINARQALAPMLAALGGVVSGAGTGTITFLGANSTTTRITAVTDAEGNRPIVTLVLPT
ncbi:MAG: hypothetical protein KatS3mg108_0527 [Isosphaeraceae bacterium]|jgi:hypothetical protein|nr:MAG: hypothetical protein KatS3mg108_0527 [Isosphaeraceae bacterium]